MSRGYSLHLVLFLVLSTAFPSQARLSRYRRSAADAVSTDIDGIIGQLNDLGTDTKRLKEALQGVQEAVKKEPATTIAKVSTIVGSVGGSLSKFKSGDPFDVASGCLDIIASVATTFGGPYGIAIGAVASLISSILSLFSGNSMGSAIKQVIDDAFKKYRDQELEDNVKGAKRTFNAVITFVNSVSKTENLTEVHLDSVRDAVRVDAFTNMLGVLESRINRGSVSTDNNEAMRTINFIFLYLQLSVMRETLLTQVILLYKRAGGAYDELALSLSLTSDQNKEATRETVTFLHQMETKYSLCGSYYYPIDHSKAAIGILKLTKFFGVPDPARYTFDGLYYRMQNRAWNRYSICKESYAGNHMFRGCKDSSYHGIRIKKLENGYHTITLRSKAMYVTKHAQGWGWGTADEDPGEQGYFTFIPLTNGFYMVSTKKWPDYFVYMESSAHGYIRSWHYNPDPQGQWKIL
uniref:Toxin CaTX-A n=1 Tax=Carybdea alata TaxID=1193083 RepID=JTX2A_CARAL|nr:RecName: Full=Toxin CaTX-A; Short=Toxin-A; AltName: Full=CAT-1; AltName: Full=Toxin CaTX-B; Short=Toxin-B; Flags: Precursor [Alatina alata]BAB12727.1 toxin-A [Alatina alata]BAB87816.1 toxin-A [Alatina alata]